MLIVVGLGAPVPLCLMAWFWIVRGSFAAMFEDFGGAIPALTRITLLPYWPVAMIAGYLLALLLPFLAPRPVVRDFAMLSVVIGGLLVVMASAASLYLPILMVSSALDG